MGNIEEFEYVMSLRYYAKRRVLMVRRQGLPEFGFPLTDQEDYLIDPETLQKLWQSHRRVFVLVDECARRIICQRPSPSIPEGGKRLIANQSFSAAQTWKHPRTPLTLEKIQAPGH